MTQLYGAALAMPCLPGEQGPGYGPNKRPLTPIALQTAAQFLLDEPDDGLSTSCDVSFSQLVPAGDGHSQRSCGGALSDHLAQRRCHCRRIKLEDPSTLARVTAVGHLEWSTTGEVLPPGCRCGGELLTADVVPAGHDTVLTPCPTSSKMQNGEICD